MKVSELKKQADKWVGIKGTNGFYQVSNTGQVRSFNGAGRYPKRSTKPKMLSPYLNKKRGYCYVSVQLPKHKNRAVHRLVAEHFIDNPKNKPQVNHKDCNKQNNSVENLEWVTPLENVNHAISNNRKPKYNWQTHRVCKINPEIAQEIKQLKGKKYYREIAEIYGIKYSTVAHIMTNRRWANET